MMTVIHHSYEGRHSQMSRRNAREEMIQGAIGLLAERGVQGTSFAVVTEATNTPRGSIYHHFPGGKNELIEEAVQSIGALVTALIDAMDAATPAHVVEVFFESWRSVLRASNFDGNCAVANTAIGAGEDDSLRVASQQVFEKWHRSLTSAFIRSGADTSASSDYAAVSIAAAEGALIMGRASRDDSVFDALSRQLKLLVSASGR
jgi:TetR/AcrR family transcriptional repressor of lmrAB and yxaGH operons